MIIRRLAFAGWIALMPGICPASRTIGKEDFIKGLDLSILKEAKDHGVQYKQDDTITDPMAIFKANGCNCVRLRLFVNPDGKEGQVNTLAYMLAIAKKVKTAGLKLYLDFHYSDVWADAVHQVIAAQWKSLTRDQHPPRNIIKISWSPRPHTIPPDIRGRLSFAPLPRDRKYSSTS